MPSKAAVNGRALALATGGAVLLYAGLRGENPLAALRGILTGSPPPVPEGTPITLEDFGGGTIPATGTIVAGGAFPQLAQAATKYLGRPYKWAGTFVGNSGGDCSGLVVRSFADLGISGVPRTSGQQMAWPKLRKVNDPSAGDLVWWPGHIGIMVSPSRMINSPHTGTVVRYDGVGARSGHAPLYLRYIGRSVGPRRSGRAI